MNAPSESQFKLALVMTDKGPVLINSEGKALHGVKEVFMHAPPDGEATVTATFTVKGLPLVECPG